MSERQQSMDFAGMDEMVAVLSRATGEIEAELRELDARLDVLKDRWTGAASEAHAEAHRAWSSAITALHDVIRDAASTSAAVTARHRAARDASGRLWS